MWTGGGHGCLLLGIHLSPTWRSYWLLQLLFASPAFNFAINGHKVHISISVSLLILFLILFRLLWKVERFLHAPEVFPQTAQQYPRAKHENTESPTFWIFHLFSVKLLFLYKKSVLANSQGVSASGTLSLGVLHIPWNRLLWLETTDSNPGHHRGKQVAVFTTLGCGFKLSLKHHSLLSQRRPDLHSQYKRPRIQCLYRDNQTEYLGWTRFHVMFRGLGTKIQN